MSNVGLRTTLSLSKFFNHVSTFFKSRGVLGGLKELSMTNEISNGRLVGTDGNGNKYYENLAYISGRQRFVVYQNYRDYDPSSVPAEWHHWLHGMSDKDPVAHPPVTPRYKLGHSTVKLSHYGSQSQYLPTGHQELEYNSWEKDNNQQKK